MSILMHKTQNRKQTGFLSVNTTYILKTKPDQVDIFMSEDLFSSHLSTEHLPIAQCISSLLFKNQAQYLASAAGGLQTVLKLCKTKRDEMCLSTYNTKVFYRVSKGDEEKKLM